MLPAALSIVMNMFAEGAERNKALGIWGGLGAGGATVGLIAGGASHPLRRLAVHLLPERPDRGRRAGARPRIVPESRLATARRRFDALGALSGTGGLVLLVDAISQAPQYGWGATRTIALLAASAALLAAFLVIESRVEAPLLPLRSSGCARSPARTRPGCCSRRQLLRLHLRRHPVHAAGAALQRAADRGRVAGRVADLDRARRPLADAGHPRPRPKAVMAIGMTLIGAGVIWATQVPVHGHFLANLLGPFFVAGAGTAFAFIPISIAALAGVGSTRPGSRPGC
jgi:hypothetical protein